MEERIIDGEGVRIRTQAFGHLDDPPVLLIAGAFASMVWWPEDFVELLSSGGRYVIRYDNRDTGGSTAYAPGTAKYTIGDMAKDAMAVLSGYNLQAGHLVGMSMGGVIAQMAALIRPHRVRTLIVINSTPLGVEWLPPPREDYRQHMATLGHLDWNDRDQVTDFLARDAAAAAGSSHPHDADAARRLIERDLANSPSFSSLQNHLAVAAPSPVQARAADIQVPTLIVHGTADPVFPIAHADAMATAVKGARLVAIEGGGHDLHREDWPQIVREIMLHTSIIHVGRL
ncbi:alpha/beta hydrolase [Labrys okinawensis]|uniref:Alpha/beta hydrolase n=1 Tax=Labrys okinawensis TaxID=346911 RepID=A0A2S9QJZ5_9HYPH|nr:alpha/beta hydrolase [Labrys okinawensis]PRH89673.1 alpha/beta hydrolase [Labrys okinawensis]